jgi:hypothetical protein
VGKYPGWKYHLKNGSPDFEACRIDQYGFCKMANLKLAKEFYERLKVHFPDLRMIDGCGHHALEQVFYLPSYADKLEERLLRQIADDKERLNLHRLALEQVLKDKAK